MATKALCSTSEIKMDRQYANAHYKSCRVNDNKEGFAAVELHRTRSDDVKSVRVARVVFWDACGDFSLETFNTDIPAELAIDLIDEAKKTIKIR